MTTQEISREREGLEAGVRAVVYGLPLVIMDITMQRATNVLRPTGMAAPVNQFANPREYPTAQFKQVVRANVDTLYSSAFLDLTTEPIVLSVPDTQGRYYLLPMFDAWTNVFLRQARERRVPRRVNLSLRDRGGPVRCLRACRS